MYVLLFFTSNFDIIIGINCLLFFYCLFPSFSFLQDQQRLQQDVSELNALLIDAIERSLVGTPRASLIQDLYGFDQTSCVKCLVCHTVSARDEAQKWLLVNTEGCSRYLVFVHTF
jgi:hypothetical protein